ncbi:MAG: prepilin-type N-terminal cleavage/methylation domain-containing protein [Nitrospirae bacterium]|nr:prepilin-type N-terminal cleavage/methylation domain-containing protein [Nitrospirota bacterium]
MSRAEGRRGLTLIEMMIALLLMSFVMIFIQGVFVTQRKTYVVQEDVSDAQQAVRNSLSLIEQDLRSAGYGIPAGSGTLAISATTNGNPDSLTMNVAQGPTTYLTLTPTTTTTITVADVTGFAATQSVTILNTVSQQALVTGTIVAVNAGAKTLTFANGTIPTTVKLGDLVVSSINVISYSLAGTSLTRTVDATPEVLTNQIQNLQFRYVLANGTEVDDPSASGDLANILTVRVTLTAQTTRQASRDSFGNPLARQLTTLVRVKNLAIQTST